MARFAVGYGARAGLIGNPRLYEFRSSRSGNRRRRKAGPVLHGESSFHQMCTGGVSVSRSTMMDYLTQHVKRPRRGRSCGRGRDLSRQLDLVIPESTAEGNRRAALCQLRRNFQTALVEACAMAFVHRGADERSAGGGKKKKKGRRPVRRTGVTGARGVGRRGGTPTTKGGTKPRPGDGAAGQQKPTETSG